jgi:hypothetical protein
MVRKRKKASKPNSLIVGSGGPLAGGKPGSEKKIRSRVVILRDRMVQDYLEMGQLLHYISDSCIYKEWEGEDKQPYKSFKDYVEKEVSFAFRKAKSIMSVWWWFSEELNGDKKMLSQLRQIGWLKASYLVGVAGVDTFDVWIKKAKELGIKELEDTARKALEAQSRRPVRKPSFVTRRTDIPNVKGLPVPKKVSQRKRWTVMLSTPKDRQTIEEALDVAVSKMPLVLSDTMKMGTGEVVTHIAEDFLKRNKADRTLWSRFQREVFSKLTKTERRGAERALAWLEKKGYITISKAV